MCDGIGKIKMVIIGIGGMGKKYAQMINDGKINRMELTAVCARSEENKLWAKENLNETVQFYSSTDELFEHEKEYDAVLIVTPHKQHPELAIRAFELGKHVFCDKPAGVSVSDAKRMQEAALKYDRKYAMMFHNRTLPVWIKVKDMLDSKTIGDVIRIHLENSRYYRTSFYHNSAKWRSSWAGEGGGALINQGQHILDYWQWLFGMPENIYANIAFGKFNDFKVDDEVTILMEYPENISAVFILTTGEVQTKEELSIIGTKGEISVSGNKIHLELNDRDSIEYGKNEKINSCEHIHVTEETILCDELKEHYETMLANFCDAVLDGKDLIATGEDGIKALELANASYISAWKNSKIKLPIDSFEYDKMLKEHIANE